MKINVGYVTAQTQNSGFERSNPVSYAAIRTQEFYPDYKKPGLDIFRQGEISPPRFFTHDEMDGFFEIAHTTNVMVVFGIDFIVGCLSKYYDDSEDLHHFFNVVDLASLIEGELETRIYLDTLGHAFDAPRLVRNGLSCVKMFQRGDLKTLKECMVRDLYIMSKCTQRIMKKDKYLWLTHPYKSEEVRLDISRWRDVMTSRAKLPMSESIEASVRSLERLVYDGGTGLERKYFFNEKKVQMLLKRSDIFSYIDQKGEEVICHRRLSDTCSF